MTEGNAQVVPIVAALRERLAGVADRESATLRDAFRTVTIEKALVLDLAKRRPAAPVPPSRVQPSRVRSRAPPADAATAASAREEAVQVSQQASQHMVRIISERRLDYKVVWSLPEADPVVTWERKGKLNTREEYRVMVETWEREKDAADGYDVSHYPPIE